ncbi:porin [Pseudooceanicola onchidii]|uniref:porin n=1 Tax=Pseudooceanicola onchidii TaxID=2562279 RepID=UPI0010A9D289|nr:porin [Pseudooceanicola onchidii]
MKKILFATTAIIATAGVAAADSANVNMNGMGRFGLLYADPAGAVGGTTVLHHRLDLNFDIETESDAGVTFGARIRMRASTGSAFARNAAMAANPANGTGAFNGARLYAESNGLTVAVGNILGAVDSMPNLYTGAVGLTGLSFAANPAIIGDNHAYSGGGAGLTQGAEIIYSANGLGLHVSYGGAAGAKQTQVAASYTFNNYTLAAAFVDNTNPAATDTKWVVTAGGTFGPATLALKVAENETTGTVYGLGANIEVAPSTTVQAYFMKDDNNTNAYAEDTAYGVGFVYGLGGGASVRGGVEKSYGDTKADLGVRFNF